MNTQPERSFQREVDTSESYVDRILSEMASAKTRHKLLVIAKKWIRESSAVPYCVAEDVVSETFVNILKATKRGIVRHDLLEVECPSLLGYILVVMRNVYRDLLRKSKYTREVSLPDVDEVEDESSERGKHYLIVANTDFHNTLETQQAVAEVLQRLPPYDRKILLWRFAEGMSSKEIAERLAITEVAVRQRAHRAMKKFKEQFEFTHARKTVAGNVEHK